MTAAVGQVLRYMGLVVGHWVQKVEPRGHGKCRFTLSAQAPASSSASKSANPARNCAEVVGQTAHTHTPRQSELCELPSSVMKGSRFYSSPRMAPNQTGLVKASRSTLL